MEEPVFIHQTCKVCGKQATLQISRQRVLDFAEQFGVTYEAALKGLNAVKGFCPDCPIPEGKATMVIGEAVPIN